MLLLSCTVSELSYGAWLHVNAAAWCVCPVYPTHTQKKSTLKEQLPVLSSGSRASTPLKKEADGIRSKLEELGEDAAEVCVRMCACMMA